MLDNLRANLARFISGGSGITQSTHNRSSYDMLINKPSWLGLSTPSEYREVAAENPIVNGCIDILARAASNGEKQLKDLQGNIIPWDTNLPVVKKLRQLFLDSPNPWQSPFEWNYERYFMYYAFGNSYTFMNNPSETLATDILSTATLVNLDSEFVQVKQTGKYYDQITIEGVIEKYVMTNETPVRPFVPSKIIHINDLNTSNKGRGLIGVPKCVAVKMPISNTQLDLEVMNTMLTSRGFQGILSTSAKDGSGEDIPVPQQIKNELEDKLKDYGLLDGQKKLLTVYAQLEYIRTVLSPEELGVFKDIAVNAQLICNKYGVPQELYKVDSSGITFENQKIGVRQLYENAIKPRVKADDEYFTARLGLRNYGLQLTTSWAHIEALSEGEKEKATTLNLNTRSANIQWKDNAITLNEYRGLIGKPELEGEDGDKRFNDFVPTTAPEPSISE